VSIPFPEPTTPVPSRAEIFLGYLDYFRSQLVSKLDGLPSGELCTSRLPSGWTPVELLKHLTYVDMPLNSPAARRVNNGPAAWQTVRFWEQAQ
jgi:hypothetical protein